MHFEGQFVVNAAAGEVLAAFEDVERMARCMPGAAIAGKNPDGSYRGSMLVAFGPKKIRFEGRVTSAVDPIAGKGQLGVTGGAQLRTPAPAQVDVQYVVEPLDGSPTPRCRVSLVSHAKLGGVLEEFARTGGVAVTDALMQLFAQNLSEELDSGQSAASEEAVPVSRADVSVGHSQAPADVRPRNTPALSATKLFWLVLAGRARAWLMQFKQGRG